MFRFVYEPIDAAKLRGALARPEDGAVAIFEGLVRNHSRGRRVRYLEYEAYEGMALRKLEETGALAKSKFDIREIVIWHRLGRIHPAECSIAIVVAAAHRAAALDACRFAIDTVKKTVPIWKKEFYENGEEWIEGSKAQAGADF
jgi:molybdopterin synthase catalytic subunit